MEELYIAALRAIQRLSASSSITKERCKQLLELLRKEIDRTLDVMECL